MVSQFDLMIDGEKFWLKEIEQNQPEIWCLMCSIFYFFIFLLVVCSQFITMF